jgi:hypothetical protein
MAAASAAMTIRIGISGRTYAVWRRPFHPAGLRLAERLATPPAMSTLSRSTRRITACKRPDDFAPPRRQALRERVR